jgi:uncharacterized protein (DUF58 family)
MRRMTAIASNGSDLLPPDLLARLERLELVTRRIFRGRLKGERRSKRRGQSVEFADFRNYVPGDDLRFIDWNLYARLDRLFLKLFLEEEDLHFHALIDCSTSMNFGSPTKFRVAQQLAAALGFIGLCRADRVRIAALGRQSASAPVVRGRAGMWKLLRYTDGLQAGSNEPLEVSLKEFVIRASGSGVVVLLTDLMDKRGYESALRLLVAQRMDVYVIHLLSPEELQPPLTGDLKLIDAEDGDEAEITITKPMLERYQQTLATFIGQAKQFCARRGITYMMTPTDRPIDQLLTHYLRDRGLVR